MLWKNAILLLLLQAEIDEAVKVLLVLKAEYKNVTGSEWKPGVTPPAAVPSGGADVSNINDKIVAQGNKVRDLKAAKAPKVQYTCIMKVIVATWIIYDFWI